MIVIPRGEVVPSRETDFVASRGRFAPKPGKNPLLRPVVPDGIVFRTGRCFIGDGATHVGTLSADTLLEAVRVEGMALLGSLQLQKLCMQEG